MKMICCLIGLPASYLILSLGTGIFLPFGLVRALAKPVEADAPMSSSRLTPPRRAKLG
jgi:hypothetical protein